jgi:hypothetical protein
MNLRDGAKVMTFKIDGFLSAGMEKFSATLRTVPEYKAWFEFAESLNRLGLEGLEGTEPPRTDNQKLTISALFVRAHKSLAAALILAELGLVGDARSVLRSAVEGTIAIRALAVEPKFLDDLIEAHHVNQRKKARLVVGNPDYAATYSAEKIAEMNATIAQVDAMETAKVKATNRKLQDITWSNVGGKYCKDLYELLYRLLSADGTHTTLDAINRMFDYSSTGEIISVKVGPDIADMVETLKAGCLMFLWAAESFADVYGLAKMRATVQEKMDAFMTLPQNEPTKTAVQGSF